MKSISGKSNLKIKGFIEIEKINKKDHVKETYHNTITPGGKLFILGESVGQMLAMSGSPYGDIGMYQSLIMSTQNSSYAQDRGAKDDQVITCTLLNLDSDVLENMGVSTNSINIWDDEFTNIEKVTAFANNNILPFDDTKEGVIDYCKPAYMTDSKVIAKRWYFKQGTGTGTINCVAMMPGDNLRYIPGRGIRYRRQLDKVNVQDANYTRLTQNVCPPGIPGFTGNSEILLDYTMNGKSKHKYNFVTGEMTDLSDSDPWFVPLPYSSSYDYCDYLYDYNTQCLYVACKYGNSTAYINTYKINGDGTYTLLQERFNAISANYVESAKLFINNGTLYINSIHTASYTGNKVFSLTRDSTGKVTAAVSLGSDYSSLGLTLPTGLNAYDVAIGMYGSSFIMYINCRRKNTVQGTLQNPDSYFYNTPGALCGFVFSTLTDFANTITDIIPSLNAQETFAFNAGTYKGFIDIGFGANHNINNYESGREHYRVVQNNSDRTNISTLNPEDYKTGCFLTLDGEWCNTLSFAKLTTPIIKGDQDELYVSYGYQIT